LLSFFWIQPNPGPKSLTFNICSLNILSLTNATHHTAVSTLAENHQIDLVTEISKHINESSDTYCDLDPFLSSLPKNCSSALLPTITNIINLSLASVVSLTSSNLVLFTLFLKNLAVTIMIYLITGLFLTFPSSLNSLNAQLKTASLIFYPLTTF